jgi:hypothetical protein
VLMNDDYVIEQRLQALADLPWALSSKTVLAMSSEDLDILAATRHDADAYWKCLNSIVTRIEKGES